MVELTSYNGHNGALLDIRRVINTDSVNSVNNFWTKTHVIEIIDPFWPIQVGAIARPVQVLSIM